MILNTGDSLTLQGVWRETYYNGNLQLCDLPDGSIEGTYSAEGYLWGNYTDETKTKAEGYWEEPYNQGRKMLREY